jgi:hypothetical protein
MYSRIITPKYIDKYRTDNIFCGFIRDKYSYYITRYSYYTAFHLAYDDMYGDLRIIDRVYFIFRDCYNEAVKEVSIEEAGKYTVVYK